MKDHRKQYTFWESPISSELVSSAGMRFTQLQFDQQNIYWLEQRPNEAGRQVIMCCNESGETKTITPAGFNVRSRVHEYGGGDYLVKDGVIYFSNEKDQQIYRQKCNGYPEAIVHPCDKTRYADFTISKNHDYLIAVRETHQDNKMPVNEIVCIDLQMIGDVRVLASGKDFYSNPRLSPDEKKLVWLSWTHPQMPWDGTELWCAELSSMSVRCCYKIAGGSNESLYQPQWDNMGDLYVVSDRTGWWNIYRVFQGELIPVASMLAECGTAQWVFGTNMYDFSKTGDLIGIVTHEAQQQIGKIVSGKFVPFPLNFTAISPYLAVDNHRVFFIAADVTQAAALYQFDFIHGVQTKIADTSSVSIDEHFISIPETMTFSTTNDQVAHAFYYPPKNPNYDLQNELPPLIVFCHSGPTAATSSEFNLKIQYWTSRGFAVVDVNYRGSLGYGRAYREALNGNWGIVDVADCVYGARYLVSRRCVDAKRLCIRGSSAGGFTALCALTFYDDFVAGASYYGVSDLEKLLDDTHKFEAKSLENLVGAYPAKAKVYRDRSPIYHAGQLKAAVIFFQGLKDRVVPPMQAEIMITAMQKNHIPCRYVTFEQEGHGFRDGKNIAKAFGEELAFYQRALYTEPFLAGNWK